MAAYSPPFTLTHAMLSRVAEIAELVGQWRFTQSSQVPMLRRENRIRTIQALLAIEPPESGTDDCSDWRRGATSRDPGSAQCSCYL